MSTILLRVLLNQLVLLRVSGLYYSQSLSKYCWGNCQFFVHFNPRFYFRHCPNYLIVFKANFDFLWHIQIHKTFIFRLWSFSSPCFFRFGTPRWGRFSPACRFCAPLFTQRQILYFLQRFKVSMVSMVGWCRLRWDWPLKGSSVCEWAHSFHINFSNMGKAVMEYHGCSPVNGVTCGHSSYFEDAIPPANPNSTPHASTWHRYI